MSDKKKSRQRKREKKRISLEEFFKIYCKALEKEGRNSGRALWEYLDKMKKLLEVNPCDNSL